MKHIVIAKRIQHIQAYRCENDVNITINNLTFTKKKTTMNTHIQINMCVNTRIPGTTSISTYRHSNSHV